MSTKNDASFEKLTIAIALTNYSTSRKEQTLEAEANRLTNNALALQLKEIAKSGDVRNAIRAEIYLDANRNITHDVSEQESDSQKATLKQGISALNAYDNLKQHPDTYKLMTKNFAEKQLDKSSLPLDAGRSFMQSQIARINNRLKAALPPDEVAVLDARKKMTQAARQTYINEQKDALGIPHDKKTTDLDVERGHDLRTMPVKELEKKYPDLKNEIDAIKMVEGIASNIPDKEAKQTIVTQLRSEISERFGNNEKTKEISTRAKAHTLPTKMPKARCAVRRRAFG